MRLLELLTPPAQSDHSKILCFVFVGLLLLAGALEEDLML